MEANVYNYKECGLENVFIIGAEIIRDDNDDEVLSIPNINGLHRAIVEGVLCKKTGLSGSELRFLRTEMGLTQVEFAKMIHRESLTISRLERGENELDSNIDTLIRLLVAEKLDIKIPAQISQMNQWSIPSAKSSRLEIDGSDPSHYKPIAA